MELDAEYPEKMRFTLLDNNINICNTAYPELPANFTAESYDINQGISNHKDWANHFEIIHQRLMIAAFTSDQWQKVLKDYYRALKPGGYLQLLEIDVGNIVGGPSATWGRELFFKLAAKKNINLNITADLSQFVEEAGFKLFKQDRREPPFTEVRKERNEPPSENNFLKWYVATSSAVPGNAHKLGFISDDEWAQFQEDIEKEALEMKVHATMPAVLIIAQVVSILIFGRRR